MGFSEKTGKFQIVLLVNGLCESKSFSALTVNDICQEAGISRATFYRMFEDKYSLNNWCQAFNFAAGILQIGAPTPGSTASTWLIRVRGSLTTWPAPRTKRGATAPTWPLAAAASGLALPTPFKTCAMNRSQTTYGLRSGFMPTPSRGRLATIGPAAAAARACGPTPSDLAVACPPTVVPDGQRPRGPPAAHLHRRREPG